MGVAPIDEKMRENHLRWFGHVSREASNESVKKSGLKQVKGTSKRWRNA